MKKFTYKDLRIMAEGDIHRWDGLMTVHNCSGKHFDVAKRMMGGIVLDDWNSRLSEADKVSVLLKMIFDAGFNAGLSANTKNMAKAVGALGDISDGEPEWPDDPKKELDWCRKRATTTLAELKGEP